MLQNDNGNVYCACKDPQCNICDNKGTCSQCFVGESSPNANHAAICAHRHHSDLPRRWSTCCARLSCHRRCCYLRAGFGVNGKGQCESCKDTNCSWCNEDYQTCTECAAGYTLVNGSCVACSKGCTTCSGSPSGCQECGYGYSLQDGECVPW